MYNTRLMKTIAVFIIGVLWLTSARAQEQDISPESTYANLVAMTPQDYLQLKLPPIDLLIENARTTAGMSFYQANTEAQQRELKTVRRQWLSYVKLNAGYNYGSSNMYSQIYTENGVPITNTTGQNQAYWNVGANLSVPLDGIFNRRNKIKQQQKRIEQTEYEMERSFDELRIKIIEIYVMAIEQLSSLQTVTEAKTMAQAQYAIAEADFMNGQLDAESLSQQKTIESAAVRTYEEVRKGLNSALLQLEVLTNTPIITRQPITPQESPSK